MNDTAITTNADSLSDCRTNVFPLADARGLHWKKFVTVYCQRCVKISEDPVLAAYSNALHQGILCCWQTSPSNTSSAAIAVNVEHKDTLFDKSKELILFWYGDEPQLSTIVNPSLKEAESGCFDDGIPLEFQSLLFKSLHNLLERETLAFSFNFFIYGESLISASVNIKKVPVLTCLSRSDLSDATSNDGIQVVLAPAGLNATVTGSCLASTNAKGARILHEWNRFYPVVSDEKTNDSMPCLVEILHNDTKMLYPSCLVGVPLAKPGKKVPHDHVQKNQPSVKDEKPTAHTCAYANSSSQQQLGSLRTGDLVSKIWNKVEHNVDEKKSTPVTSSTKTDTGHMFGPNKPLWDFKDRTRSPGCGCTSSTNVNRTKSIGRFTGSGNNMRNSQTNASSSTPNLQASNQVSNVNPRPRKERKKSTLPFHQRRTVTTERSPTPPIGLPAALKASIRVGIQQTPLDSSEVDRKAQDSAVAANSQKQTAPRVHSIPKETPVHIERNFDRINKPMHAAAEEKSATAVYDKAKCTANKNTAPSYSYASRAEEKHKPDYILPVDLAPKRPHLGSDLLESRNLATDASYTSLYSMSLAASCENNDVIFTHSPLAKVGETTSLDSEVKIVRLPNKGIKRSTDQVNDPSSKRCRSQSGIQSQQQQATALQLDSQSAQMQSRSSYDQQSPHHQLQQQQQQLSQQQLSQTSTQQSLANQQQQQLTMRRGPGRPKKPSCSSSGAALPLTSPTGAATDVTNIFENDVILSPPSVDRRRKSGTTQNAKAKDGLVSPPPISTIKAGGVKSRRRPSKKSDQSYSFEADAFPMMSPSARSNPPSLSPLPHLPSPARTPGSTSGISFTHSRDLTVNISDLDKLFEGSDEEDDELTAKVNALPDSYALNARMQNSDDVFRTMMQPPVTSNGLPHDLAEMFPTPPSQETQIHPSSPALSTHGEYTNPSSITMCHAVMSPEKHPSVLKKKFDEFEIKSEITEGLESPFSIPEWQIYPAGDMFLPVAVLPSMKCKPLKINNSRSLQYAPSWEATSKAAQVSNKENQPSLLKLPKFNIAARPDKHEQMGTSLNSVFMSNMLGNGVDMKNMDVDMMTSQASVDGIAVASSDARLDIDASESLELALRCRQSCANSSDETTSGYLKDESASSSPYSALFKGDKELPYESQSDRNVVSVATRCKAESECKREPIENTDSEKSIPYRILDLFKEQWQSSFSTLYLTKIVSRFYGISRADTRRQQAMDVNPSCAMQLLHELSPRVQEALKTPLRRRSWEINNKITGPACFQELHRFAGKSTQHSNLPVHPLLTGADGDLVSVSPTALKYWKKLFLEPFGGQRDVAYVVVAPDSDLVLENTKQFFKELSGIYESMNLGKHCPITRVLREGIIRVGQKVMQILSNEPVDEWFSQDDTPENARMKLIAQVCKYHLGPHLSSLQLNRTLFEKSDDSTKFKTPVNAMTGLNGSSSIGISHDDADSNSCNGELPAIVVYMIDPFPITGMSGSKQALWSFNGLLRAFSEMTATFSESLKNNVFLQIVPLESILQSKASTRFHNGTGLGSQDTQQLAFSVYSTCRLTINSLNSGKICTSFGQGALRDKLAKRRQEDNQFPTRIYLPPCVLAPHSSLIREDPHSAVDLARVININDYNVLFCSYCLSSDLSWLLVTCTDKRGLLSNATVIKVLPQNRPSKPSRSPRRLALRRLLNFITDAVSFHLEPWRIVISRLGRPGHGEFKDLYDLVHKIINVKPSAKKRPPTPPDVSCNACRSTPDDRHKSQIQSISLIAIQPEPLIKLMPVGNKKKTNLNSRIFVVQPVNHHRRSTKDRHKMQTSSNIHNVVIPSLPLSQQDDDLLSDLLSQTEDDDHFMPMLPSPTEVHDVTSMYTSPHPDLGQPVFSPGDGMISSNLSSPRIIGQMSTVSPFQPIMHHNSPAFGAGVMSPSPPLMYRPSSSTPTAVHTMTSHDEFAHLARQPMSVGYIISGYDLAWSSRNGSCPSVIKSELLLHVAKNDGPISQHPLDSENHLELHRYFYLL
eukprot:gene13792-15235_t